MKYFPNSPKKPLLRLFLLLAFAVFCLGWVDKSQAEGRVFITNTLSNTVSVVDDVTGSLIANIPVGVNPIRIVASQDGTRVYTSNFGGGTVSVIDTVNLVVTATIPVSKSPQESDITIDGTRLFVVDHPSQVVSVIDLATNTVSNVVSIGDPSQGAPGKTATDITFSPNGHYAFVPNYSRNVLDSIDTKTYAVTEIPTGDQPRRVAVTPSGKRVFVANFVGDSVTVADARRLTVVGTIPTGDASRGIAVNRRGNECWVTNVNEETVTVLTTGSLRVIGTIPVESRPWNIIFNGDGTRVIVSNTGSDTISVIDSATKQVIKTVPVGNGPFFAVYNEDETRLYISNSESHVKDQPGSLTIIDTSDYSVIGSVELQLQPFDLAYVNP